MAAGWITNPRRFGALLLGLMLIGTVGVTPAAAASPNRIEADLDGASVPGGGDPDGAGTITVWLDPTLTCSFITADGIDEVTAIEIRIGAPTIDLGLVADITPEPDLLPGPCATLGGLDVSAVLANPAGHHVLIRTAAHPDGALRGQLRAATSNALFVTFEACPSTVRGLKDVPLLTDFGVSSRCRPVIHPGHGLPDGYRWSPPEPIVFDWAIRLTTGSGAILSAADFDLGPIDAEDACIATTLTCLYPPNGGSLVDPALATPEVTSGSTSLRLLAAPPGHRFGFADVWADTTQWSDEPISTIHRIGSSTTVDPATIAFDSTGFDDAVVRVFFVPPDLPDTSTLERPGGTGAAWVLALMAGVLGLYLLERQRRRIAS